MLVWLDWHIFVMGIPCNSSFSSNVFDIIGVGFVGDVGLEVTLFGFGGTIGFCILEGFGGKGGRGVLESLPVVCLLIGLYVAGE
jgi:hypothetical protein